MSAAVTRFCYVILSLLLSACVSAPQSTQLTQQVPLPLSSPVNLEQVPFFPQQAYQCGPAALATVLGSITDCP